MKEFMKSYIIILIHFLRIDFSQYNKLSHDYKIDQKIHNTNTMK